MEEADIAWALQGNWREKQLFMLKQALALCDDIVQHLAGCDARLDVLLDGHRVLIRAQAAARDRWLRWQAG